MRFFSTLLILGMISNSAFASDTPNRCLAVRGNGELIMAHFSSLAALTEHFGLFDGLAGGSSASLSMFVYESILQSPALKTCGNAPCSDEQKALRAALLLKSVYAYIDILKNSSTGQAALKLYGSISSLQSGLKDVSIDSLPSAASSIDPSVVATIQTQFHTLLQSSMARELLNPRTIAIMVDGKGDQALGLKALTQSPADLQIRAYRLREFYHAIQTFGNFTADSKAIFFRPSLVSFDALAQDIGLIANFYAGRGNRDDSSDYNASGIQAFADHCADRAHNLTWYDFASANPDCKTEITNLIQSYSSTHTNQTVAHPRVHDQVGQYLHILASSAVIPGAAEEYKSVARKFLNASGNGYAFQSSDFNVFEQLKFGYFGNESDIGRLMETTKASGANQDYKMQRAVGFSGASWEEVINYSPAEPGLSALTLPEQLNALPASPWKSKQLDRVVDSNTVMAAGWSDLTPTFALRNIGCKEVLYISRREPESSFALGLVVQLGATQTEVNALYNLDPSQNPPSSFANALAAADGVWCTDWNAANLEIPHAFELDHDAYVETDMETASPQTITNMLLDPNDVFRSRIVPHHFEGCGGVTPVIPGHLHTASQ